MEREACVCDHGLERSDLCAEIIMVVGKKLPASMLYLVQRGGNVSIPSREQSTVCC